MSEQPRGPKIRDLTTLEQKLAAKYLDAYEASRQQLQHAAVEEMRARNALNDMAIAIYGSESGVVMDRTALYEKPVQTKPNAAGGEHGS